MTLWSSLGLIWAFAATMMTLGRRWHKRRDNAGRVIQHLNVLRRKQAADSDIPLVPVRLDQSFIQQVLYGRLLTCADQPGRRLQRTSVPIIGRLQRQAVW